MKIRQLLIVAVFVSVLLMPVNTGLAAVFDQESGAEWVVHFTQPGNDIADVGTSLFDELFSTGNGSQRVYNIPFPFESLINHLGGLLAPDNGKSLVELLIPKGRSLQREAAAPNYFLHPRRLLSAIGEPVSQSGRYNLVFKYRIFIAYQEVINQLEIISYNEESARFEFQVVDNYGGEIAPVVKPASRSLCMSCHQNGGPIFSSSPWDETNFNPQIAIALARSRPDKYSNIMQAMSKDVPGYDIATNDANYFSGLQLIWRSGCGGINVPLTQSSKCRGALLKAMLQHRLSGDLTFDATDENYQKEFVEFVSENWKQQWPNGLLIPASDIPDLNPFEVSDDLSTDPSLPRQPVARWIDPDERFFSLLVRRISSFFTRQDIQEIDNHLVRLANNSALNQLVMEQRCVISRTELDGIQSSYQLTCDTEELKLDLQFMRRDNTITQTKIQTLNAPDHGLIWRTEIDQPSLVLEVAKAAMVGGFTNQLGGSARFSSGNRLKRVEVSWNEDRVAIRDAEQQALVRLSIEQDFQFAEKTIETITADTVSGYTDALGPLPFRRRQILKRFFQ